MMGWQPMTKMRRRDREVTDLTEIKAIVEKNMILHLGLFDEEFPYVVPLHYGYEYREETDQFTFYTHGARQGHKIDLIYQNPNVCVQIEGEVVPDYDYDVPCKYGAFLVRLSDVEKQSFSKIQIKKPTPLIYSCSTKLEKHLNSPKK